MIATHQVEMIAPSIAGPRFSEKAAEVKAMTLDNLGIII